MIMHVQTCIKITQIQYIPFELYTNMLSIIKKKFGSLITMTPLLLIGLTFF